MEKDRLYIPDEITALGGVVGTDGLTDPERQYLGDRYREEMDRPLTSKQKASRAAFIAEKQGL